MLLYKKLLLRAEANILTKNKMTFSERIIWNIHCFFFIYRFVFGSRNWLQTAVFVTVGLFYVANVWLATEVIFALLQSAGSSIGVILKWLLRLFFSAAWFVGFPAFVYGNEYKGNKK